MIALPAALCLSCCKRIRAERVAIAAKRAYGAVRGLVMTLSSSARAFRPCLSSMISAHRVARWRRSDMSCSPKLMTRIPPDMREICTGHPAMQAIDKVRLLGKSPGSFQNEERRSKSTRPVALRCSTGDNFRDTADSRRRGATMEAMFFVAAIIWFTPAALLAIAAVPAIIWPRYRRYLAAQLVGEPHVVQPARIAAPAEPLRRDAFSTASAIERETKALAA